MRAHGIDIAYYELNYNPVPKPPRLVDFAIIRSSYGLIEDTGFRRMLPGVLAASAKGAYHYPSSAIAWKPQADFFIKLMDGKFDFWAWDVEKSFNTSSIIYGVVPAMNYIKQVTGKPGLLYLNPDMWRTWYLPIQKDLLQFDIWLAHYQWIRNPEAAPTYFNIPGCSNMRRDWKFWQYDDKGMGGRGKEFGVGSLGLDLNVFNGTKEEMLAWLKITPPRICPCCNQPLP
jgi:GH25 family lysozyme M1 (1,4-beta-N-acetylmuramidase)